MEITDEVRAAVLAEVCATEGHQIAVDTAIAAVPVADEATGPARSLVMDVGNSDPDEAPYLRCTRCGMVWLVIEDGAADYDAAETAAIGQMRATGALVKRLIARRQRRIDRLAGADVTPAADSSVPSSTPGELQ